jgi:hypothetical protein
MDQQKTFFTTKEKSFTFGTNNFIYLLCLSANSKFKRLMSQIRVRNLIGFKLQSKQLNKFELVALLIILLYFAVMSWLFFKM